MEAPHGGGLAHVPSFHPLKNPTRHLAIVIAAASTFITACVGHVEDAVVAPYREPREKPAVYEGMFNETQGRHLRGGTFPKLSDPQRRLLARINAQVNRDIQYLSDASNYATPDLAITEPLVRKPLLANLPPARYGDCEDYALTKKHRLAHARFSASRAFVALAMVPGDYGPITHSVLAVPEGGDWWILNNWDNLIQRASSLERWWDWEFIRPRYDSYLLSVQTRRIAEQSSATLPAAGSPSLPRE